MNIENTFKEKLYECNKHIEKILSAKKNINSLMPLTESYYIQLSEIETSFIDQLIFRFSKLQDTIGEKIFPSILKLSKEDIKRKTFIDILNRLEELEIVNKNRWLKLREIRNEIAHEYSFNTNEIIDSINDIYIVSDELIQMYKNLHSFCEEKFEFILNKKALKS